MGTKMSCLAITGTNAKVTAKEVFNSFYELTKDGKEAKLVNESDHLTYINMNPDNFTLSFLTKMFADRVDCTNGNSTKKIKCKHNTWDKFVVPANYFYNNQPKIDTTIGRFVMNKFLLEGSGVISLTHYINEVINKGKLGDLDNLIAQLWQENKIGKKEFNAYVDRRDNLGYWLNGMLAHTLSEKMLSPLPEITAKKKELIKKYEKELASGNVDVMTNISKELIDYAKELLKDDPGMDLYLSGDLDFANNYKNNSIIKGAVLNKITNEYDFIGTSFMDGIDVHDIPAHANSILASQFPASIGTADAGYLGKKILALLQMMRCAAEGTDCGTKNLIPLKITKKNKDNVLYTYIAEGDSLVLLTKDNINKYVGKTVKMRSPMSCKDECICEKCAGRLFYMLDIEYAGLFGIQISHADLNLALKAKHVSVVTLYTLNPDDIIEDIE